MNHMDVLRWIAFTVLILPVAAQDAKKVLRKEDPTRPILADLASDDPAVRQRAVEAFGQLDPKDRERATGKISEMAARLAEQIAAKRQSLMQKLLANRPDSGTLRAKRSEIMNLAKSVKEQTPDYQDEYDQLLKTIKEVWEKYYPQPKSIEADPEMVELRGKLADLEKCAELAGARNALERIANAKKVPAQSWEYWLSPGDLAVMRRNERTWKESKGTALEMDEEEYTFTVWLNLYLILMGQTAKPFELRKCSGCREHSKKMKAEGRLFHAPYNGECVGQTGQGGESMFWGFMRDWPHHNSYFIVGTIGVGRDGQWWTFRP